MASFKSTFKFPAKIKRLIANAELLKRPRVDMTVTPYRVAVGKSRPAPNIVVLRTQRKQGRNPWFLSAEEKEKISALIKRRMPVVLDRGNAVLRQLLRDVGAIILQAYNDHIDDERNPRGKFKPLSPAYAERKRKEFGNQPILVKTGQLRRALKYKDHVG